MGQTKPSVIGAFFVTLLASVSVPAMTIDFETVPAGATPQAHEVFVGDTYDVLGVDFYSKSDSHPRWNFNRYGNSGWFVIGGYQTPPFFQQTAHFGLRFAEPATSVSMDLFVGAGAGSVQFWAYDADDVFIPGVVSITPGGNWVTKTITAPGISRIEAQGTILGAVVAMDNLDFQVVPLPGSMLLLAPAIAGLVRCRRPA